MDAERTATLADAAAPAERRSACADAARQRVESLTAHLTPQQRDADFRDFNAKLALLVQSGRLAK